MNVEILNCICVVVKNLDKKSMLELTKSQWLKFSIGLSFITASGFTDFLLELIKIFKGW